MVVTETIRANLDVGDSAALVLLDQSAAFDTVSHAILLQRLQEICIRDLALEWLRSFLAERSFQVHVPPFQSQEFALCQGVPQGSVLSPLLFNIYVQPLATLARDRGLALVSYSDDTQLVIAFSQKNATSLLKFKEDLAVIADWMAANCLQLNAGKSEILLFGKDRGMWSESYWPDQLKPAPLPKETVKNLGIWFDSELTFDAQSKAVAGMCFGVLRGSWAQLTEFILFGFPSLQGFQILLFWIFLPIYLLTATGNSIVFLLTILDHKLQTPMYFFISHLSFLDLSFSTVTLPKMLANFLMNSKTISISGCIFQMYMFLSLGSAECLLLTVMSFDRYYAICQPLQYAIHMTKKLCIQLALVSWIGGFLAPFVQAILASRLPFCGPNVIHHYYCDHPPLLHLACANTSLNVAIGSSISFFLIISSFSLILFSYAKIILSIIKISSRGGRRKTFSTCASHLIVVNLFYLPIIFMYIRPAASVVSEVDSLVAVLYSVLTPMLNPMIYTLRNKDIKEAFRRKVNIIGISSFK
ncbi:olfactory receptor 6N1-like [Lissotriton helveticus]